MADAEEVDIDALRERLEGLGGKRSPEALRERLSIYGQLRAAQKSDEETLMGEVEVELAQAYGIIPVSEAANLLGMHRTTVYRVYHPHAA